MPYEVILARRAEQDLEEIVEYIARADSRNSAHHVMDRLVQVLRTLAETPERGAHPPELLAVGIREYRQLFFKPYRLVYQVVGPRVVVQLIADGRRDMPALLARRLLRP